MGNADHIFKLGSNNQISTTLEFFSNLSKTNDELNLVFILSHMCIRF